MSKSMVGRSVSQSVSQSVQQQQQQQQEGLHQSIKLALSTAAVCVVFPLFQGGFFVFDFVFLEGCQTARKYQRGDQPGTDLQPVCLRIQVVEPSALTVAAAAVDTERLLWEWA